MMIDVSASEFRKWHGGLIELLLEIQMAGQTGVPTTEISRRHGWQTLVDCEKDGYITRKTAPNKKGGPDYVMNYLTSRGARLLKELGEA